MVVFVLLLSYLLGSISFALLVGKFFYKKDIRNFGSGNLGATNTFRILGWKAGLFVAIADITKGTLACFLPLILNVDVNPILCGSLAIIGHVFPVFASFKGGKAVATSTGVFLFLAPLGILFAFLVAVLTVVFTRYVSLGSILGSFNLFLYCFFFETNYLSILSLLVFLFILLLHRENIKRILNGSEPKIK